MTKRKTTIYLDEGLWRRFRAHASNRGVSASYLLEELIREELADQVITAIEKLAGPEDYQRTSMLNPGNPSAL